MKYLKGAARILSFVVVNKKYVFCDIEEVVFDK